MIIKVKSVPARARCMWSKSELARQTGSERFNRVGKQMVDADLIDLIIRHTAASIVVSSVECYHLLQLLGVTKAHTRKPVCSMVCDLAE